MKIKRFLYNLFYGKQYRASKGDILCHIGVWKKSTVDKWLNQIGEDGKLIIIDAEQDNILNIKKHIEEKNVNNVLLINKACYYEKTNISFLKHIGRKDATEQDSLKHGRLKECETSIEDSPEHNVLYEEVSVEADTLDNILNDNQIYKLDFLYITAMGSELEILKGASKTLKKIKKLIVSSTFENKLENRPNCEVVIDYLKPDWEVTKLPKLKNRAGSYLLCQKR